MRDLLTILWDAYCEACHQEDPEAAYLIWLGIQRLEGKVVL